MKILIIGRFFFSSRLFPKKTGSMKSRVSVELEASTSDDSVDIDAERTRTRAIPKTSGDRFASIAGMIASKPSAATSTLNSLPNPPRK